MSNALSFPRRFIRNSLQMRVRLLLVVGALILSVALPFKASQRQMTLLIALPLAIAGILILLRWPPLGLVTLIIFGLIVPSPELPGGVNIAVLYLALLIVLWVVNMVSGRRELRIVASSAVRPLFIFIIITVISFGVGNLPWFSIVRPAPIEAQLGGLAIFVLSAGAFLLTAHQIHDIRWLQWMTWVFIALASLHIAGWFVPGVGSITSGLFQYGTTSNSMFWVWLVALAFSQAVFNNKLRLRWRLLLLIVVAATIYVALIRSYDWKSGWIPVLAVVASIIAFRSKRLTVLILLAGAVPAFNLALGAIATDQYSYSTRIDAWLIMLEIIKVNPILGFGPANYYWYTALFPIRGYSVEFNSHNQYLDIVAQTGLLGLACFIWFAWEVGRLGWRLRSNIPSGFAQAYVYGVLGGLVGMLAASTLVDWVLPFVYNIGMAGFRMSMLAWLFLGGLVSIEQISNHGAKS